MQYRPPLTAAELPAIYKRESTGNVLQLLQEIHGLRATIRRVDQIRRMIVSDGAFTVAGLVRRAFENE